MSTAIGKSILVKGKVQGVFYRASTLVEAQKRNLTGSVKNLPDGDVFVEIFGDQEMVLGLIKWCEQGPEFSKVDHVVVEEIPFRNESTFQITY